MKHERAKMKVVAAIQKIVAAAKELAEIEQRYPNRKPKAQRKLTVLGGEPNQ
jgi:hypothetical protein